jgi:hypothetical protein
MAMKRKPARRRPIHLRPLTSYESSPKQATPSRCQKGTKLKGLLGVVLVVPDADVHGERRVERIGAAHPLTHQIAAHINADPFHFKLTHANALKLAKALRPLPSGLKSLPTLHGQ